MLTNKRKGKYNANRVGGVRSATGYLPFFGGTTGARRRLPFFFRRVGWRRAQRGQGQARRFDDLPPEREREREEPAMIRQRKELLHGHGEEDLTSGGIRGRFQEPEISKIQSVPYIN